MNSFFGKLLAFSMFALFISGLFFADEARATDCTTEFQEWQKTTNNQNWACNCYLCLWCSSATGKNDQARLAYEACMMA